MSGGKLTCPISLRGCNGPPPALGGTHTHDVAALYSHIPGLIVTALYDVEDARGLLKSCIRNDNPTCFLENENLYGDSHEISDEVQDKDFVIPIGKAKIMREGKDISILTYQRGVRLALQAAKLCEEKGISVEVINLRTIRPLDFEAIAKSVKKTGRVITIEECYF